MLSGPASGETVDVRRTAAGSASLPHGEFARLLETEGQLEARLRQARAEAAALVAAAQAEAARGEAALAAELDAAAGRRDAELGAEQQRREQEIAAAARRDAEAYEQVPGARVAAIARSLARRLVSGEFP